MPEPDFVYQNAPLIEVIAEIRWKLLPLKSLEGAEIDPHFEVLVENFEKNISSFGFQAIDRLVPERIPLELVPGKIVFQYREQPNSWPVFQLGPGIFTINMTPPYDGWPKFRQILDTALHQFLAAYPLSEKYLNLNRVELRYLDAFTSDHGFESYPEFLKDHLGIDLKVSEVLLQKYLVKGSSYQYNSSIKIPLTKPKNCTGTIKATVGQKNQEDAVICEFSVRNTTQSLDSNRQRVIQWFDQAHNTLRDWFMIITSQTLKKKMGPQRNIGGQ